MTFCVLLFITRKPTLSPTEFRSHWDTKHVELLKSIAGSDFPLTHTRQYISRTDQYGFWNAAVLVGAQEDFTYDGIAELVFEDEAAFQSFFGIVSAPEAAAKISADEDTFMVREKMKAVVLGETSVTSRQ
ncbi:hypothetical protein K491DRAFT_686627 [Lophiostoma macrostomum CBS 122681]|uniref:EthD domain-containing protein n=1 Tax=Lophiostoma macrostomum CBS 122681 TaxID=1314788 RepID=A0A6A6TU33_9PLEO|nr:hypothetical protein K491DRAFT_686627 [Lophiostoma macrostomum CBS 122681]